MNQPTAFYTVLEKVVWGSFNEVLLTKTDSFEKYSDYIDKNKDRVKELDCLHVLFYSYFKYKKNNQSFCRKQKYVSIQQVLKNTFLSEEKKDEYINCLSTTQKHYIALNRFAFLYKYKKARYGCTDDMYMNPISKKGNNYIEMLQENTKYIFTIPDITKIIRKSLHNSEELYADPLPCKNPYCNLPFTKSNLYAIYFAIKKSDYNIPEAYHTYFQCNFSLTKFLDNYECMLRERAIDDRSKLLDESCTCDVKNDILDMIEMYNDSHSSFKIDIHDDFPEETLFKTFTPYVKYYYRSMFSLNTIDKAKNRLYWRALLKHFAIQNPLFGRKTIKSVKKMNNKRTNIIAFNDIAGTFEAPCNYNTNDSDCHIKYSNIEKKFITDYRKDIQNAVYGNSTHNVREDFNSIMTQYINYADNTINNNIESGDENDSNGNDDSDDSDDSDKESVKTEIESYNADLPVVEDMNVRNTPA